MNGKAPVANISKQQTDGKRLVAHTIRRIYFLFDQYWASDGRPRFPPEVNSVRTCVTHVVQTALNSVL